MWPCKNRSFLSCYTLTVVLFTSLPSNSYSTCALEIEIVIPYCAECFYFDKPIIDYMVYALNWCATLLFWRLSFCQNLLSDALSLVGFDKVQLQRLSHICQTCKRKMSYAETYSSQNLPGCLSRGGSKVCLQFWDEVSMVQKKRIIGTKSGSSYACNYRKEQEQCKINFREQDKIYWCQHESM